MFTSSWSPFDVSLIFHFIQATYPSRVRRALMELNRSVCIDMPESGVPWFHEKYCQEQIHTGVYEWRQKICFIVSWILNLVIKELSWNFVFMLTDVPISTNFHEDIYQCLVHIFGCDKFIKRWAYSPYYHLIGTFFYVTFSLCDG